MKTQKNTIKLSLSGKAGNRRYKTFRSKRRMNITPRYLNEEIDGEYPDMELDYSRLSLTRGILPGPRSVTMEASGPGTLIFDWPPDCRKQADPDDTLIVIILCEAASDFWERVHTGVTRSECRCMVQIPSSFEGRELHVWLTYLSARRSSFSNSQYLGEIITTKAASHESV